MTSAAAKEATDGATGWGWPRWVASRKDPLKVLSVLLNGSGGGTDFQGRGLLGERYLRWQAPMPEGLQTMTGLINLLAREKGELKSLLQTAAMADADNRDTSFDELMDGVDRWWLKEKSEPDGDDLAVLDLPRLLEAASACGDPVERAGLVTELSRRQVSVTVRVPERRSRVERARSVGIVVKLRREQPGGRAAVVRSHDAHRRDARMHPFTLEFGDLADPHGLGSSLDVRVLRKSRLGTDEVVATLTWTAPFDATTFAGEGSLGPYTCTIEALDDHRGEGPVR